MRFGGSMNHFRKSNVISVILLSLLLIFGYKQFINQIAKNKIIRIPITGDVSTYYRLGKSDNYDFSGSTLNVSVEIKPTPTPTPTPTKIVSNHKLPIIEDLLTCDSKVAPGHILFSPIGFQNELYIMDGNGCNVHLVMENIEGSADWSADGEWIAVGCYDNEKHYICILDAENTLETCLGKTEGTQCEPVILEKYPLPEQYEFSYSYIYNVSWSGNGDKLLVKLSNYSKQDLIFIMLDGSAQWELVAESFDYSADLSPKTDKIIMDGLREISEVEPYLKGYMQGWYPEWSSDGEKLAFLYSPETDSEQKMEQTGIMQMTMEDGVEKYTVLYQPRPYSDSGNYMYMRNIYYFGSWYRLLSWSPDNRYIAFVSEYAHMNDIHIFRLDTYTGEIFVLTNKLDNILGEKSYLAPAWGP